ncbi:MAG: aldehyde ferredoxin oxidoreductase family protein [Deltaproteobacteria bacterium]|nr:aldehyde ferredoxin oxidoreductase family protein [Candidatus Zymogenaceae bacterium]
MHGHTGKYITVNLSNGSVEVETYDTAFARKYLGGNGFAAALIRAMVPKDSSPFSPENTIVFAVGPLTGTPVWGCGRGHVASISPLTGIFADSNYGGDFAVALKKAGCDALAITGASDTPVYLSVTGGSVVIKDASDLWGMDTRKAHEELISRGEKGMQTAIIGPGGENRVLFASVMMSGRRLSAAGRGGVGAVMGAKKLKAVVAGGDEEITVADKPALTEYLKTLIDDVREKAKGLTDIGTPILVNKINAHGTLGTRNNSRETFSQAGAISGEVIKEKYMEKRIACRGCPVACGKTVAVPRGDAGGRSVKMPEYETIYSLGSMLENDDIISIMNANSVCDDMGLDTISMGVTLSFVAECLERGAVTEEDLGYPVRFADGEHLTDLVKKTAYKEGVGELLALGSRRLAERFGGDAAQYLYQVKGMEIAGHSARGLRMMSLGYATSTRGGSHHDTRPVYSEPGVDPGFEGQVEYVVKCQHNTAVGDSLVMCRFLYERAFGMAISETLVKVIALVTGWDQTLDELELTGERIYTLERIISTDRGIRRADDTLPYRVMHEPIGEGPAKGRYCPPEILNNMLDAYYRMRGWDEDGVPTDETVSRLGLG